VEKRLEDTTAEEDNRRDEWAGSSKGDWIEREPGALNCGE